MFRILMVTSVLLSHSVFAEVASVEEALCEYVTKNSLANTSLYVNGENIDKAMLAISDKLSENTKKACELKKYSYKAEFETCNDLCLSLNSKLRMRIVEATGGERGWSKETLACHKTCVAHSLRNMGYSAGLKRGISESKAPGDCTGTVSTVERASNKSSIENSVNAIQEVSSTSAQ